MNALKYIIVGCGRSGTRYTADYVSGSGVKCDHEKMFDVFGYTGSCEMEYESSWYAVPYLEMLPQNTKVLHLVRSPNAVIASWYRIGILADKPWQFVTRGKPGRFALDSLFRPQHAFGRLIWVQAHRRFLNRHLRLNKNMDELERLEAYWTQWNQMIEMKARARSLPYMRVKLEEFSSMQNEIVDFLNLPTMGALHSSRNEKKFYVRSGKAELTFNEDTVELIERYGYKV